MFNVSFYVLSWLFMFLVCLPIIFSGLLAVAFEKNETPIIVDDKLSEISALIDANINDKAKLRELLERFKTECKTCEKDAEKRSLWLDVIGRLTSNMNLMEVDEVVGFQDFLEHANPEQKAAIKEIIGKALQKREGK